MNRLASSSGWSSWSSCAMMDGICSISASRDFFYINTDIISHNIILLCTHFRFCAAWLFLLLLYFFIPCMYTYDVCCDDYEGWNDSICWQLVWPGTLTTGQLETKLPMTKSPALASSTVQRPDCRPCTCRPGRMNIIFKYWRFVFIVFGQSWGRDLIFFFWKRLPLSQIRILSLKRRKIDVPYVAKRIIGTGNKDIVCRNAPLPPIWASRVTSNFIEFLLWSQQHLYEGWYCVFFISVESTSPWSRGPTRWQAGDPFEG